MDTAEIDLFKFFIDKAYAENTLLYTRSTVFTSVLALMAGFTLKELALVEKRSSVTKWWLVGVALVGLGLSVAWFFVTQRSIEYVQAWQHDAYRIAAGNETIQKYWALRWRPPQPGAEAASFSLTSTLRFWTWRPSTWYKALAILFGTFWLALLIFGLCMRIEGRPPPPA